MAAPIAIVGISVELPSGSYSTKNLDHPSFFQFLLDGGESYEHIPGQRFNVDAWRGDHPGQVKVDTGSFLKDIDLFDNVEFGISSRDARAMAPVTRRLIEHSFLALLDAGIDYRGKRVGCYMSGNGHDLMSVTDADEYEASGSFAGYPSMVANRISTHLDLRGPSIPVDTACSSTLTALHLAIQAIRNDECEAAVVGGCQLNHRFIDWVTYSQGSLLAKDGKCKPFDANADGFSRAEGCVVVVVKLLENALRDHDRVYATILASAINSSGGQAPPGAPVASAQHDSMLQAFKLANRLPQEVDYIELHATGTSKGDPTEANWIGAQFQRDEELMIGSVKGNIGHTEIVAFMASLSKVLSMFQHRVIPPNVNVRSLNPAIRWEQYKLHLPLRPTPLSCRSGRKPLIAMASSGIGGSNGHVVLEGPPTLQKSSFGAFNSEHVLALLMAGGLSPRSVTSISESVNQLAVKDPVDVCTLSTVLGRRSRQMTWRSYAIWDSKSSEPLRFSPPQHTFRVANPLVFVFSGQGPQHVHMGRELFKISSAFRDSILEMDVVFSRITNKSIIHDYGLFDGDSAAQSLDTWPISLILPAIAMVQIALFDLLVTLGIKPDIIIGHSAGETAVLYASGAGSKAMVVELAILRGMVFAPLESLGASMVALSCSPEEAETIMEEARLHYPDTVLELACYNSPNAIVMAGHNHGLDQVLVLAEARGIFARRIRTRVPIHSSLMENCKREYCCRLDELFSRYPGSHTPTISTYSTLTGDLADGSFNAEYFWKNTRGPVRFTEAIHAIARIHPSCTFVEIAPHPALSAYISSMVSDSSTVLTTLRRPKQGRALSEYRDLLEFIGKLIVTGHDCVDFTILNGRACHDYDLNVPAYPFVRKQYPLYADTPGYMKQMEPHRGSLNHPYLKVNKDTHPILGEHIIRGQPIMPAAGFIEMALEFGATSLMNVNMRSILSLSSERPTKLDVRLEGSYWSVRSFTSVPRARGEPISTERLHADGYLSYEKPKQANKLDISAIRKQCPSHVGSAFYDSLSYFSSYGPHFRRVTHVYYGFKQALASIRGMDGRLARDGKYIIHPAILDSCLHVAAYKSFHGDFNPNAYFLPASVETVIVHQPLKAHNASAHLYAHLELKKWMPDSLQFDITLMDSTGWPACSLLGVIMEKHRITPIPDACSPMSVIFQPAFMPTRPRELHEYLANRSVPAEQQNGAHIHNRGIIDGLGQHITVLRNVLSYLANGSHMRILRVLIIGSGEAIHAQLQVLSGFPTIFFELFVSYNDGQDHSEPLQAKLQGQTFRNDRIHLAQVFSEDTPVGLLDIITFYDSSNEPPLSESVLHDFSRLLVPSGVLLLTKRDEDGQATVEHHIASSIPAAPSFPNTYISADLRVLHTFHGKSEEVCFSTIDSQKISVSSEDTTFVPLFDEFESFVLDYKYGHEAELQWDLSGLFATEELRLWIMSTEGIDGSAAFGLARALRREYLLWKIHVIIFPGSFTYAMRLHYLKQLPQCLQDEFDIRVTDTGEALIPRLVPLPQFERSGPTAPPEHYDIHGTSRGFISVNVSHSLTFHTFSGIFGSIGSGSDVSGLKLGTLVVGLTAGALTSNSVYDPLTLCPVPPNVGQNANVALTCLPGLVIAFLAAGMSAFNNMAYLRSLRVLVTHADTAIGFSICHAYSLQGLNVSHAPEGASLLDLASLGRSTFDLIVSGFDDAPHCQILQKLLLARKGRMFLWNDHATGLAERVERDPCSIADALQLAVVFLQKHIEGLPVRLSGLITSPPVSSREQQRGTALHGATFDAAKTYLILGGIGNLGAHVALFMYQRGARHIVVTSRRGEGTLRQSMNPVLRRMFEYLLGREDLDMQFRAADAISPASIRAVLNTLTFPLGGSIILTAVLSDRTFQHLDEEDFTMVFAAKVGVLRAFKEAIFPSTVDLLIAFTSVVGIFGNGGQSNYAAANTALEEEICSIPNAFSFVCPGIIDSSLMLAGKDESKATHLAQFTSWSLSAEDMIAWLDDAICRHQHGHRFNRYIPSLDWEELDRTLGMPKMGRHLVSTDLAEQAPTGSTLDRMADIIRNVLNIQPVDFSFETPLTAYGIDSLSAGRLSFLLRPIVDVSQLQLLADVSANDIHRNSARGDIPIVDLARVQSVTNRKDEQMRHLLASHTQGMNERFPTPKETGSRVSEQAVFVTGTTGALGCNILHHLLQDDRIEKVYAFNRQNSAASLFERQKIAFSRQGLPMSLLESPKLILITGDLRSPCLGLNSEVFEELLFSVTHIIHAAWRVDFYSPLEAFEDLIAGTRDLLEFAAQSKLAMQPMFSFISTVEIYRHPNRTTLPPEQPITNPNVAIDTGYLESKWVAERLTQIAAEKLSIRTNVIRTGLLTGGLNGYWDTAHWFPALAQSAVYVGCLPEGDENISWLPMDLAAAAIVDMRDVANETLHLIHPQPTVWNEVIAPLASALDVPLVPYPEWFSRLESMDINEDPDEEMSIAYDQGGHPKAALQLLHFYRQGLRNPNQPSNTESMGLMPRVVMQKGIQVSPSLRDPNLTQLERADVQKWVAYWRSIGFLPLERISHQL